MAEMKDQLEIRFRLSDGSDIGPTWFPVTTTVAALKETVCAEWPTGKENGPKTVKDVKLISAGKILDNNRTVKDYKTPVCDDPEAGATTMLVIIQPKVAEQERKKKNKKKGSTKVTRWICLCFGRTR